MRKGGFESIMIGAAMAFFAFFVILMMIGNVASIPALDFTRAFSGLGAFIRDSRNLAGVLIVAAGIFAFAISYIRGYKDHA